MSLQERLLEDMKDAMKSKNKKRLSVIRMTRAAIKDVEINKRKDLSDEEVIEVLSKLVKQSKESLAGYQKAKRDDKVKAAQFEIKVLKEYLPKQLGEDELVEVVEDTIKEVEAEDMSDIGQVMGAVMPKIKSRADGSLVNKLVRQRLQ